MLYRIGWAEHKIVDRSLIGHEKIEPEPKKELLFRQVLSSATIAGTVSTVNQVSKQREVVFQNDLVEAQFRIHVLPCCVIDKVKTSEAGQFIRLFL
ncbi:hypothetical protein GGP74_000501 [Salinibacter ruber]|nr:hypothetical protein [Salinibacter ruber]